MTPDPDELPARTRGHPQHSVPRERLLEVYETVQAFFRRRVPEEHTAHDLTQTTFLRFRVWQGRNPGLMPDNLEAFLLRQAEWLRREHFRKAAKSREFEASSGGPTDMAALEDGKLLVEAVQSSSLSLVSERVDLGHAAATLSDTKRLVLVLRFVDGLPTSRIAAVLARCPRRVNQLIQEALDELARSEPLAGYGTHKGGHQ